MMEQDSRGRYAFRARGAYVILIDFVEHDRPVESNATANAGNTRYCGPSKPQTGNNRHSLASQYWAIMMYTISLILIAITAPTTRERSIHVPRKYAANNANPTARHKSRMNSGVVTHSDGRMPARSSSLTRILLVIDTPKSPCKILRTRRG